MADAFKDHFSSCSTDYARYRPGYPSALARALAERAPSRRLALDGGCGTGQLSIILADEFEHVIAIDASPQQIASATPHARVEYRVARCEDTGLPAASVDLVTAAQAVHWFDLDAFYAEVRRVLRPGGVIALVTYGATIDIDGEVGDAFARFAAGIERFWPPERRHVNAGYRSLPFPFAEEPAPPMAITVQWNLDDFLGCIGTLSAVRAAEQALGREALERLAADLRASWGRPADRREIRLPIEMRLGRV